VVDARLPGLPARRAVGPRAGGFGGGSSVRCVRRSPGGRGDRGGPVVGAVEVLEGRPSSGVAARLLPREAMEEYVRCLRDPETICATCKDFRAATTLDYEHDAEDREAGRHIACPVLALWGRQGFLQEHYDVLDVWRGWAEEVHDRALECGHYLPEEAPEETYAELHVFSGERGESDEHLCDQDPVGHRQVK
jgi:pimeloyl-ACP methyl ester carboxylesterase